MKDKTTNNSISVGIQIIEPKIMEAKMYLKKNFENKFDADPHFNFVIMALPEHKLHAAELTLNDYFKNKNSLNLQLGELYYEAETRFFSIPIIGEEVMHVHKELLSRLNAVREGFIRLRDLERIESGRTDAIEKKYIYEYGYLRVLDKFHPHITIGNLRKPVDDIAPLKNKLDDILSPLYNKNLVFNKVYVAFIEEAEVQSEYKFLWEKEYNLESR